MSLLFYVVCFLAGSAYSQSNNDRRLECPQQEEIFECTKEYVKDLADRFVRPIHNVFTSSNFYITPQYWSRLETEEVCKVKDNYIKYLRCALRLRERCVLAEQKQIFLSDERVKNSIDFLCGHYKCNDCSRDWVRCDRCDNWRYFDFECAQPRIVNSESCMGENKYKEIYISRTQIGTDSDEANRRRIDQYHREACAVIHMQRKCSVEALAPCGIYTSNMTDVFAMFARPYVCSASLSSLSVGLIALLVIMVLQSFR